MYYNFVCVQVFQNILTRTIGLKTLGLLWSSISCIPIFCQNGTILLLLRTELLRLKFLKLMMNQRSRLSPIRKTSVLFCWMVFHFVFQPVWPFQRTVLTRRPWLLLVMASSLPVILRIQPMMLNQLW